MITHPEFRAHCAVESDDFVAIFTAHNDRLGIELNGDECVHLTKVDATALATDLAARLGLILTDPSDCQSPPQTISSDLYGPCECGKMTEVECGGLPSLRHCGSPEVADALSDWEQKGTASTLSERLAALEAALIDDTGRAMEAGRELGTAIGERITGLEADLAAHRGVTDAKLATLQFSIKVVTGEVNKVLDRLKVLKSV